MGDKISVKNPLGINVTCSTKQWYNHVISQHQVMRLNKRAVEETLENPDSIHTSTVENRMVYFKKAVSSTYSSSLITKVVTEKDGENHEKVVTSFPTPKAKGGIEDEIYHKQNKL